ncbi:unnamed protein product, partial [Ectocarpus sp. 12 AP-2014]
MFSRACCLEIIPAEMELFACLRQAFSPLYVLLVQPNPWNHFARFATKHINSADWDQTPNPCPTYLFICFLACARSISSRFFAHFLAQENDTEEDPNRIILLCFFFDVHPNTKWHFLLLHLLYTPQNPKCVRLPTQELHRLLACSPPSTHLLQHCRQARNGHRLAPAHRSNLVTIIVL